MSEFRYECNVKIILKSPYLHAERDIEDKVQLALDIQEAEMPIEELLSDDFEKERYFVNTVSISQLE